VPTTLSALYPSNVQMCQGERAPNYDSVCPQNRYVLGVHSDSQTGQNDSIACLFVLFPMGLLAGFVAIENTFAPHHFGIDSAFFSHHAHTSKKLERLLLLSMPEVTLTAWTGFPRPPTPIPECIVQYSGTSTAYPRSGICAHSTNSFCMSYVATTRGASSCPGTSASGSHLIIDSFFPRTKASFSAA